MSRCTTVTLVDGHEDQINSVVQLGNNDTIVTASEDGTMRTWSVVKERSLRCLALFKDPINDMAVLNHFDVIVVSGRTVVVVSTDKNGMFAVSSKNAFGSLLRSCAALNSTRAVVGDESGDLYQVRWNKKSVEIVKVLSKAHRKEIAGIFSHDRDTFATCSGDGMAKLWDSKNLSLKLVFQGNEAALCCVTYNRKVLVTGSKDYKIRVFDMATVQPIKIIDTHKDWVRCIRIVEKVDVIVSSGSDIALHSCNTGALITRAATGFIPTSIAVLDCGRICTVGCQLPSIGSKPIGVKILEIDQLIKAVDKIQCPSELEIAFSQAVSNPSVLTRDFIQKHIRAENVKSAVDLYCGHNIILLAIRCGTIKAADLAKFNGDAWFFRKNLYHPASKQIHESSSVLYPIFRHAEDIGIVNDGHVYLREHEIRVESMAHLKSIQNFLGVLSDRLARTEKNFGKLSYGWDQMEKRLSSLAVSTRRNACNFNTLFHAIKKKEKYMMYASCVKVILYLIPLIGKAIGEASYASAGILFNLNAHDLVKTGADTGTALTQTIANTDLSNPKVAYCALSEQILRKMETRTQTIILDAAEKNGFKSIKSLRSSLKRIIQSIALEEKHIALLDMGSSLWLGESSPTRSELLANSTENQEFVVRGQFKLFAKGKRTKLLKIVQATEALNIIFNILEIPKQITADDFEMIFVEVSNEFLVDEQDFFEVFSKISTDIRSIDREQLAREYAEIFEREMAGKESNGIVYTTRLLRHACKEMKKRGFISDVSLSDLDITDKRMAVFDPSGNEKFNCAKFVEAALSIVEEYYRRKERKRERAQAAEVFLTSNRTSK